jgi:hypothetical protein
MLLRLIEPEEPGFDAQTFECQKCFVSETFVISISGADVSTALSLASQTAPPPCGRYHQSRIVSRLRGAFANGSENKPSVLAVSSFVVCFGALVRVADWLV